MTDIITLTPQEIEKKATQLTLKKINEKFENLSKSSLERRITLCAEDWRGFRMLKYYEYNINFGKKYRTHVILKSDNWEEAIETFITRVTKLVAEEANDGINYSKNFKESTEIISSIQRKHPELMAKFNLFREDGTISRCGKFGQLYLKRENGTFYIFRHCRQHGALKFDISNFWQVAELEESIQEDLNHLQLHNIK